MKQGFTLVEILLVVAAIGVIASFGTILGLSAFRQNDLQIATVLAAGALRRAQILSLSSQDDSSWSVHFENNSLIVFKAQSFAGRDQIFDEETDLGSVTAVVSVDAKFAKFTGRPVASYVIQLVNDQATSTLTVNALGAVDY